MGELHGELKGRQRGVMCGGECWKWRKMVEIIRKNIKNIIENGGGIQQTANNRDKELFVCSAEFKQSADGREQARSRRRVSEGDRAELRRDTTELTIFLFTHYYYEPAQHVSFGRE